MKIGELTTEEFKELIGEIIEQKLRELLDPDYGLEFREEFIKDLQDAIASRERIPLNEIKKKLELSE